eukprot:TRINITY_DN6427_c0_g1_i1.p1 TRINITY_DN6427_c0_g1~~TRINITY_DN6427_c0_g1_i1.p1  ORF type:complete len:225 (-),score=45.74 TRINITY_DN6427_c0_g1_i1:512-1186(-)
MFPTSSFVMQRACCRVSSLARAPSRATLSVQRRPFAVSTACSKTFEPDYLDSAVPQVPCYPPINIQMKSYNFHLLESYQSFVHNLAENMGITVSEAWATPAVTSKITNFKEGSTLVATDFTLNLYERNVQVSNLRSIDAPILLDSIRAALPQSVQLSVHEHKIEMYEDRFIPDPFINTVRSELAEGEQRAAAELEAKQEASAAKTAKKQAQLLKSIQDDEDEDY